ncbi:hypothetical protein M404DRAFT_876743 [Pisolithus tinctorius Marx 270]|uniref:Uncharacterized protein n=1 Tax=Pisolithus tinctorius Marx 270 TaxID=870435 RepID=A0A0C3KMH7_PISTI|nr:hypothetical protein M404DRAFT_876743 [Pisolithus tinctorius Marx 270]
MSSVVINFTCSVSTPTNRRNVSDPAADSVTMTSETTQAVAALFSLNRGYLDELARDRNPERGNADMVGHWRRRMGALAVALRRGGVAVARSLLVSRCCLSLSLSLWTSLSPQQCAGQFLP